MDVDVRHQPTRTVAVVRRHVRMDELAAFYDTAYGEVARTVGEAGARISGPALGWYHGRSRGSRTVRSPVGSRSSSSPAGPRSSGCTSGRTTTSVPRGRRSRRRVPSTAARVAVTSGRST